MNSNRSTAVARFLLSVITIFLTMNGAAQLMVLLLQFDYGIQSVSSANWQLTAALTIFSWLFASMFLFIVMSDKNSGK